jgi:hypothetical protein
MARLQLVIRLPHPVSLTRIASQTQALFPLRPSLPTSASTLVTARGVA